MGSTKGLFMGNSTIQQQKAKWGPGIAQGEPIMGIGFHPHQKKESYLFFCFSTSKTQKDTPD
jgi:hypothetical protein